MSNSPLVSYTKISPNKTSPRNHKIDTITIHCVVGQCTVETLGNIFAPTTRQASSNYGVGKDGRIGMYVEEKDRSWCTSSGANDHRAITIEVASDTYHPYAVTEEAYAALIELCADICKRNGIKRLLWKADKSLIGQPDKQNMTVHRWFANKACPGDFLYNRHADIAAKVNARLGVTDDAAEDKPAQDTTPAKVLYRVQIGAFAVKSNATAFEAKVKAAGFDTYLVNIDGLYKVQVGAFSVKANADAMLEKLTKAGYAGAFITSAASGTTSPDAVQEIKAGSKVRVKSGATTYDGKSLASFVYERDHIVSEIADKRAVITYDGVTVAAVYVGDLVLAE